jgi:hypothetical protein
MSVHDIRKGMPQRKLDRITFERRYLSSFVDPAFVRLRPELQAIVETAWQAYSAGRNEDFGCCASSCPIQQNGPCWASPSDVSVKETSICIVDDTGRIVREVKVASEPEALLQVLGNPIHHFKWIGLEAGPRSTHQPPQGLNRQRVSLMARARFQNCRSAASQKEARRGASLSGSSSKVHPKPLPPSANVHMSDPQGHLGRALAILGKRAHRRQSGRRRNRQKNRNSRLRNYRGLRRVQTLCDQTSESPARPLTRPLRGSPGA